MVKSVHIERNDTFEPLAGFDPGKAIDFIVFFAAREGGKISKLKLIKLIYLTEREFISNFGHPSLMDEYFSLPHGPIFSSTLNIIDKKIYEEKTIDIFRLRGKNVVLTVSRDKWAYDEMSDADFDAAGRVWEIHGAKTASQLRNFTHDHCSEYTHVDHSRLPIFMENLLTAAGVSRPDEIAEEVYSIRRVTAIYG